MAFFVFANFVFVLAAFSFGSTEGQFQQQQQQQPQQQQQFSNGPPPNGFSSGPSNQNNGPPMRGPPRDDDPQKVVARLTHSATVQGVIVLTRDTSSGFDSVRLTGNVTGLAPNSVHGFHIHEFGDVTNGCANAGPHFNPRKTNHGSPMDNVRHEGDLGNIVADRNGIVILDTTFDFVRLGGPGSAIGRSIVVHEKVDDLGLGGATDSLTTGNAGARLACGAFVIAA